MRLKAEVVSNDEREAGLRRILNFGHTFGHALEAETRYTRLIHGEAVSWGMRAATYLASEMTLLPPEDSRRILDLLNAYGPIPSVAGIGAEALQNHLVKDKKTIQSKIHFVLPTTIGRVVVTTDAHPEQVRGAIARALSDCQ